MVLDYVGVDVSKSSLDINYGETFEKIANETSQIEILTQKVVDLFKQEGKKPLFVLEPTGGYERILTSVFKEKRLAFHVAHANKVRYFARSKGQLAKTDKIDACIIREYGQTMKVKADEVQVCPVKEEMGELTKRRTQLINAREKERCRLDKRLSKSVVKSLEEHIKWLNKQIKDIEDQITDLSKDEKVKADMALLTSVKGVSIVTATTLIAFLPELGKATNKQLSALVGVAPYNHDSGKFKGKRFIYGGRHILRRALYMSALSSIRWNPDMSAFYKRLRANGKPAKLALIAVARKLICLLNSMVKRQETWVENRQILAQST